LFVKYLLPNNCVFCRGVSNTRFAICSICYRELPWLFNACYQCGSSLDTVQESIRCQKCIISPPCFDKFCALFNYKPPISNLITNLKFKYKLAYGEVLGKLLLAQYPNWYKNETLPEAIVPVPLSKPRFKNRGFNQVQEILRPLQKNSNILDNICLRTKHTTPQTKISIRHRKRNLRKAFMLTQEVPHKHIAIMDDVVTTGSTINAISEAFREAGVQQIDVWCICKT
jgi:ComF family protein